MNPEAVTDLEMKSSKHSHDLDTQNLRVIGRRLHMCLSTCFEQGRSTKCQKLCMHIIKASQSENVCQIW